MSKTDNYKQSQEPIAGKQKPAARLFLSHRCNFQLRTTGWAVPFLFRSSLPCERVWPNYRVNIMAPGWTDGRTSDPSHWIRSLGATSAVFPTIQADRLPTGDRYYMSSLCVVAGNFAAGFKCRYVLMCAASPAAASRGPLTQRERPL